MAMPRTPAHQGCCCRLPHDGQRIVAIQEQWAGQGCQVLLVARRVVPRELLPKVDPHAEGFDELVDGLNSELIIVGLRFDRSAET
jgi:hypothetical protein